MKFKLRFKWYSCLKALVLKYTRWLVNSLNARREKVTAIHQLNSFLPVQKSILYFSQWG